VKQHSSAIVDSRAEIGSDVEIGPFAVIGADARIGDGCRIGPHAVIHPYSSIGARCRIHAGAVIGDLPQDTAFKDCRSFVEIGADCILREGVTIHRGTEEDTATIVGDGCFLMVNSHVGHNAKVGKRVIMANGSLLAGRVEIGDGVFISGNAAVHQFVKIGRLAMLSGMSGASKDLPPFCTLHGCTMNQIGGLNTVGMRRAGLPAAERQAVKRVFTMICASELNVSQALAELEPEYPEGPAREFIEFVKSSQRGICRMPLGRGGRE
jgi:UDP-N-acetylglucosamine acyltransferase